MLNVLFRNTENKLSLGGLDLVQQEPFLASLPVFLAMAVEAENISVSVPATVAVPVSVETDCSLG